MKEERLKSYLQKRLGDYKHPVEDALWDSIAASSFRVKRWKRVVYIASGAIAAAIVITFILLPSTDVEYISERSIETIADRIIEHSEDQQREIKPKQTIIMPSIISQEVKSIIEETVLFDPLPEEQIERIQEQEIVISEKKENQKDRATDKQPEEKRVDYERLFAEDTDVRKERRGGLSVSMAVSSFGAADIISGQKESLNSSYYDGHNDLYTINLLGGSPLYIFSEAPASSEFDARKEDVNIENPVYNYPISFAVLVQKALTNKIAIESGLNYTMLNTTNSKNNTSLKIHYVGIPLKVVLNLYETRRVSFYGTLGGMAEVPVMGKLVQTSGEKRIKHLGVQYSLGVSAGLNLKISKHLGVFAEPGFCYFFDDGSTLPSIRKYRPEMLTIQLGLRFNL